MRQITEDRMKVLFKVRQRLLAAEEALSLLMSHLIAPESGIGGHEDDERNEDEILEASAWLDASIWEKVRLARANLEEAIASCQVAYPDSTSDREAYQAAMQMLAEQQQLKEDELILRLNMSDQQQAYFNAKLLDATDKLGLTKEQALLRSMHLLNAQTK
jgi:hypothetical protein